MAQRIKNAGGQHDALVRLQGELGRSAHRLPVMRQAERLQTQVGAQFKQMLAPGFLALSILRLAPRIDAQLPRDPLHKGRRHGGIWQQPLTRKAQQAQLHGDAQAVRIAAPLANQRQVGLTERVVLYQFVFGIG